MRFKKIYIEITNVCNMNCSFCPPHNRKNEFMKLDNFKMILDKIKPYTKYIYLHVKGEPLLHPDFDKFVEIAHDEGFFVNVTTNGTLLKDHLEATKYIRQINISLHATNDEEIIKAAKQIKNCYVNFRVWNCSGDNNEECSGDYQSPQRNKTISILEKEFDIDITSKLKEKMTEMKHSSLCSETNFTLKDNFYISIQNKFKWPELRSDNYQSPQDNGYCHALKDHIAILVDGTVVPCCLDNNGDINLGNIFEENFEDILNSKKVQEIIKGFENRKCVENLCKNCEYKKRFDT